MIVLFFVCWIIFNGRVTLEIVLFGLVISLALYAFAYHFFNYRPKFNILLLKKTLILIRFFFVLLKEIFRSTATMVFAIFDQSRIPEPVLVSFSVPLRTNFARTILANSISLTPGTITVRMSNERFEVHCFDKSMALGIDSSDFVQLLSEMEEVK